ncbi:hypothetical protein [Peterkaempfera sp. SMS 1(5)a]
MVAEHAEDYNSGSPHRVLNLPTPADDRTLRLSLRSGSSATMSSES